MAGSINHWLSTAGCRTIRKDLQSSVDRQRENMEFITFPIRVGGNGGLSRAKDRSAGLMYVLGVIAGTPRAGWPGSEHEASTTLHRSEAAICDRVNDLE